MVRAEASSTDYESHPVLSVPYKALYEPFSTSILKLLLLALEKTLSGDKFSKL